MVWARPDNDACHDSWSLADLRADDVDRVRSMLALAADELSEQEYATWLRARLQPTRR